MILKTLLQSYKDVVQEIAESPRDLRDYLADAATGLLAESRFLDLLPGFVLDSERVPLIRERIASIACGGGGKGKSFS